MNTRFATIAMTLLIACGSASAGTTTTYICTDAKGAKSIQDQPCPGETAEKTVATVNNPTPLFDTTKNVNRIWCNHHRSEASRKSEIASSGRTHDQRARAYDAAQANLKYLAQNCGY